MPNLVGPSATFENSKPQAFSSMEQNCQKLHRRWLEAEIYTVAAIVSKELHEPIRLYASISTTMFEINTFQRAIKHTS